MDKEIIYKTAEKLEKMCKKRNAYHFYYQLRHWDSRLLSKLHEYEKGYWCEKCDFEKVDYSVGKMGSLVSDFIFKLDEELYEKLWKLLEEDTTIYIPHVPKEKNGINSVGLRCEEIYNKKGKLKKVNPCVIIDLAPQNNTKGIATVAHEYGHILEQRFQDKVHQRTDCIGEISSMFIEKLFLEHMLKTHMIDEDQYKTLRRSIKQEFVANVRTLLEEYEILSQLKPPITGEQLCELEAKYRGKPRYEILKNRVACMINENGKEIHGEHVYRYVVGEVVSELMLQDYKTSPKETLERYKNFIEHNAEMTKEDALETLLGENYKQRIFGYLDKEKVKE